MPSLQDIPKRLRKPDARFEFIFWLTKYPTDWPTRRTLMNLWTALTGVSFSLDEFYYIKNTAGTARVP